MRSFPSLLSRPPALAGSPDAGLLSLGAQFERLHGEWQDLLDQADDIERLSRDVVSDLWRRRKETGYDSIARRANEKVLELDVVAAQMRAIPAKTLQGLAIKARLTQFDANLSRRSEMKGPERDWDWDVRCMERFVRELQQFADLAASGGAHE